MNPMINVSSLRLGEACFLTPKTAPSGFLIPQRHLAGLDRFLIPQRHLAGLDRFLIPQRHLAGLDRFGRFAPTGEQVTVGVRLASPSPAQPMEPKFLETNGRTA
jgi:hypothetical protein